MTEPEELADSDLVEVDEPADETPSVIITEPDDDEKEVEPTQPRLLGPLPPPPRLPRLPSLPVIEPFDEPLEETATTEWRSPFVEWDDRSSVMPMSMALRPRPSADTAHRAPMVIGSMVGMAIFMIAIFVTWRVTAPASASEEDSLILTAAGPSGEAIPVEFFVDGMRRCDTSPCRVSGLAAGHHFVNARAAGYLPNATRVIEVKRDRPTLEHIELLPEPPKPQPVVAAAPIEPFAPAPQASAAKPRAAAFVADAELNLSSMPIASVVLDGRPLGRTPQLGIRVKPGPHEIVFVNPDSSRIARSITLGSGERQTVAVRF